MSVHKSTFIHITKFFLNDWEYSYPYNKTWGYQQAVWIHSPLCELDVLVETGFVAVEMVGENEKIVGFASLEIYSRKLAEIRSLVVADHRQGIGVGKKLVSACVERARQRNILEVMVVTSSDVFFQNCGFDFTLPGEKKALFIQPHLND